MKQNKNTILILYEGDTEKQFYKRVLDFAMPKRLIPITWKNLKGIGTCTNKKIIGKIFSHCDKKPLFRNINVFICIDRDGSRDLSPKFDIDHIYKTIKSSTDRVSSINEVIATQDLESWFFYDIEGIFDFLKVKRKTRNPQKFNNPESFNNKDLSKLFRQYGKSYIKGNNSELIPNLNIDLIYVRCTDLKNGIDKMIALI